MHRLLTTLFLSTSFLFAAEVTKGGPVGHVAGTMPTTETEAEAAVAEGDRLRLESNKNPTCSVQAALAYVRALPYYEKNRNETKVSELQGYIFWLKKRMNADDVRLFNARKTGRSSLFTQPSDSQLQNALRDLRQHYKQVLSDKSEQGQQTALAQAVQAAREAKDDAAVFAGWLTIAQELALSRKDYVAANELCELRAERFGLDEATCKEALFAPIKQPVPQAIILLQKNPNHAEANTVLGKFWCFNANNWERGLPLLALGEDKHLQELAEKELKKPTDLTARQELADKWYDYSRRGSQAAMVGPQKRAFFWYTQIVDQLPKSAQTRIRQRIASIEQRLGT